MMLSQMLQYACLAYAALACLLLRFPIVSAITKISNSTYNVKHSKHSKLAKSKAVHMSAEEKQNRYGVDLPSFAFDYSELVASAVIERAVDSDDLYLNVYFVGHRSIFNNFPFETISTDEEVLHKWGQAIKLWKLENSRYNHELLKRSKKSSHTGNLHSNHALACALHNNEDSNSPPYVSSGHWVSTENLPDHVHGNFEILRCRIKGTNHFYDSLIHSDRHLSVDILSRGSRYSAGNSSSVDHRDLIISFYVPWRTRVVGYGLEMSAASSKLDPWEFSTRQVKSGAFIQAEHANSNIRQEDNVKTKAFHCAADYQYFGNNETFPGVQMGLPSLVEFLVYHYSLGIDHVILGLRLDWKSVQMKKYLATLKPFIESNQLSVVSISLQGHDKIGGFAGIHLHDEYAELFFLNMCLGFTKGLASTIFFSRVNEFFVIDDILNETLPSLDSSSPGGKQVIYHASASAVALSNTASLGEKAWISVYTNASKSFVPRSPEYLVFAITNTKHHSVCLITRHSAAMCSGSSFHLNVGGKSSKLRGSTRPAVKNEVSSSVTVSQFVQYLESISSHYTLAQNTTVRKLDGQLTRARASLGKYGLDTIAKVSAASAEVLWNAETKDYLPSGTEALKRPFWLPCNTESLVDVTKSIFGR